MLITAYCELRVEVPQLEKGYFVPKPEPAKTI
jgi:hypothetical protein